MNEPAATSSTALHRGIATQCNNAAWALIEQPDLDAGERTELVRLAATASYHWHVIGTPNNIAHADLLFSWALARADAGPTAVDAARRALLHFTENQSQNWERAFAHAAMAISLHCNGDQDGHRRHYLEAKEFEASLASGDLKLFQAAFQNVPQP